MFPNLRLGATWEVAQGSWVVNRQVAIWKPVER